jgi:2-dehydropantoate 2-reductase
MCLKGSHDMRIAIMGTGSLGTILGAYLVRCGYHVDMIDINREHVEALNKCGATVCGAEEFNVPVNACTPDEVEGIFDLVFFMVKQTCNESAIAAISPHIHESTIICAMQNGLPERVLAERFGADRVLGCIVGWGATFRGLGISELTSDPEKMTFELGEIDGKITDRLLRIREILQCMCPVYVHENLIGVRWSKLLINSTFSAMSAITGSCFGDVYERPEILRCAQHLGNECLRVAKAAGISVEPSQGIEVESALIFSTDQERKRTSGTYSTLGKYHRLLRSSMLQDLEKGRKCEIDAINGMICATGKKLGVPTPINDQVVRLVHEIEDGRLAPAFENVGLINF